MEIRSAELGELQAMMIMQLREIYLPAEASSIIRRLFSYVTGLGPAEMVLEKKRKLSESEIYFLQRALKRIKQNEPLQYVLGSTNFYGLEMKVSPAVLIPRPETEELVEWILADHKAAKKQVNILDIGTGSGCIAICLKKNLPESMVQAIDISAEALEIAEINAASNDTVISFQQLDILDESARENLQKYDLIVSNPPYVTPADLEKMMPNVSEFEPSLALFVDEDDPLLFYNEIIEFSLDHLGKKGKLYFECNEGNAGEVVKRLKNSGFKDVELRKDMQGRDRMVMGVR